MAESHTEHDEHNEIAHVMSIPVLLGVFVALLVLTVLTVFLGKPELFGLQEGTFNFGSADLLVALIIATIKATLVGACFMHLRYDKALNASLFVFSLLFVALFVGFVYADFKEYNSRKLDFKDDYKDKVVFDYKK